LTKVLETAILQSKDYKRSSRETSAWVNGIRCTTILFNHLQR